MDALEVDEVWDRAGETRHGYIELGETADQVMKEVLEPLLEELGKHQELGLNTEANRMCMGSVLGLYRFKHESTCESKDWAPDAPIVFTEMVVDAWKVGVTSRVDIAVIKAFIEGVTDGWAARLI